MILKRFTKKRAVRVLRFLLVGGSGVVVNLLIFTLTQRVLAPLVFQNADTIFRVASVIGGCMSILSNFVWNDLWTWGDRHKSRAWSRRLIRYFSVSLLGIAVQTFGADWIRRHFTQWGDSVLFDQQQQDWISMLAGIALATVINFLANHYWTFSED